MNHEECVYRGSLSEASLSKVLSKPAKEPPNIVAPGFWDSLRCCSANLWGAVHRLRVRAGGPGKREARFRVRIVHPPTVGTIGSEHLPRNSDR